MSEFKIGDQVEIVKEKYSWHIGWMGRKGKIIEIDTSCPTLIKLDNNNNPCWVETEYLRKIEEPKQEFKIGDVVIVKNIEVSTKEKDGNHFTYKDAEFISKTGIIVENNGKYASFTESFCVEFNDFVVRDMHKNWLSLVKEEVKEDTPKDFKIGDKVKVKNITILITESDNNCFTNTDNNYVNKIGTIVKHKHFLTLFTESHCVEFDDSVVRPMHKNWLELVKEEPKQEPKQEFKVGDWVIVKDIKIGTKSGAISFTEGKAKYIGQTHQIQSITDLGYLYFRSDEIYGFSPEWVEKTTLPRGFFRDMDEDKKLLESKLQKQKQKFETLEKVNIYNVEQIKELKKQLEDLKETKKSEQTKEIIKKNRVLKFTIPNEVVALLVGGTIGFLVGGILAIFSN